MHGEYPKRVNEKDVDHQMTNQWLKSGGLKSETEGFIIAAQDQAIQTNYYCRNILNDGTNPMCRICGQYQETIDHIVAGCPELAKTEYLHRHDKAASYLHWNICKELNINVEEKWYEPETQTVTERSSRRKAAYSLICPSLLKITLQLKLLKSCQNTKTLKSRLSECGE